MVTAAQALTVVMKGVISRINSWLQLLFQDIIVINFKVIYLTWNVLKTLVLGITNWWTEINEITSFVFVSV